MIAEKGESRRLSPHAVLLAVALDGSDAVSCDSRGQTRVGSTAGGDGRKRAGEPKVWTPSHRGK